MNIIKGPTGAWTYENNPAIHIIQEQHRDVARKAALAKAELKRRHVEDCYSSSRSYATNNYIGTAISLAIIGTLL